MHLDRSRIQNERVYRSAGIEWIGIVREKCDFGQISGRSAGAGEGVCIEDVEKILIIAVCRFSFDTVDPWAADSDGRPNFTEEPGENRFRGIVQIVDFHAILSDGQFGAGHQKMVAPVTIVAGDLNAGFKERIFWIGEADNIQGTDGIFAPCLIFKGEYIRSLTVGRQTFQLPGNGKRGQRVNNRIVTVRNQADMKSAAA